MINYRKFVATATTDFRWRDFAVGQVAAAVDLVAFWEWSADSRPFFIALWGFLGYAALGWRRSWPKSVFTVLLIQSVSAALIFNGYRPTLGLLIAFFTVCAYASRRSSIAALLGVLLVDVFWTLQEVDKAAPGKTTDVVIVSVVSYALLGLVIFTAGQWRRTQLAYVLESQGRETAEAASAVVAERNRIAAELHDIVAHAVTVVILQAAAARQAERAYVDQALVNIENAGQQAMTELRRLLLLVQPEGNDQNAADAVYGPPPGVANVAALIDVMRSAGLRIDYSETGSAGRLDPGVDLTVYRIMQEALTNVAKHAGIGAHARVAIHWHATTMEVLVSNDKPGSSVPMLKSLSTGHGLTNLRERARSSCGHLEASRREDGGFAIHATLPVAGYGDESTRLLLQQ